MWSGSSKNFSDRLMRGVEIIAELETQFAEKGEDAAPNPVPITSVERTQSIRAAVDELAQSLEETLKGLQSNGSPKLV